MGLDCTAYKNIREMSINEIEYETDEDEDGNVVALYPTNGTQFYINPDFPHSAQDIKAEGVYSHEDRYNWRAGSYSGYNEFRSWLATIGGWESAKDAWKNGKLGEPFFEMIHFSDCEGTLGTKVCQKLLNDFNQFQDKVDNLDKDYKYYKDLYNVWKKALELAAQNGAIRFH